MPSLRVLFTIVLRERFDRVSHSTCLPRGTKIIGAWCNVVRALSGAAVSAVGLAVS
jgi:hypothetical protein